MSLYNLVNGVNPATFLFLPMLGKHPDEYPRFRDCGITKDNNIVILTRTGGPNRGSYGEEEITKSPYFLKTYDADWDNTYGYYEFKVPSVWKNEFESLLKGNKPSQQYLNQMCEVYPKLKDKFYEIFKE